MADESEAAKALLKAEAKTSRDLKSAVDSVVKESPDRPLNQIKATMAGAVLAALMGGRGNAREASRSELAKRLSDAGLTLGPAVNFSKWDRVEAATSARSYSDQFGEAVAKLRENGHSAGTYREAAKATEYALDRTAATETASAFVHERLEAARRLDVPAGVHLMWRWNSENDRRVCGLCESMDGTEWEPWDSPPESMPAHPNCRCVPELVSK
jgi:hypothetical protein